VLHYVEPTDYVPGQLPLDGAMTEALVGAFQVLLCVFAVSIVRSPSFILLAVLSPHYRR
jgi:hypothetical protein